jgi:hypothetical protein
MSKRQMTPRRSHRRLDALDVLAIVRAYHVEGVKQTALALKYGTYCGHISRIVNGDQHPWAYAQVAAELSGQ